MDEYEVNEAEKRFQRLSYRNRNPGTAGGMALELVSAYRALKKENTALARHNETLIEENRKLKAQLEQRHLPEADRRRLMRGPD